MKAKRIVAFVLIALLQIGACLALVGKNSVQSQRIEHGGESYRFAIQSVTTYRSNNQTFVNIFYPPALPLPEEDYSSDTTVYVIDVGADGLARQKAKGVSFREAEQTPDLMLYSGSPVRAIPDVDAAVLNDLQVLSDVMERIRSLAGQYPSRIVYEMQALQKLPQKISDDTLRTLAQKQIDAMQGDELYDSYVTGILYEGTLYLQDLYIAGVHIASLQSQ